MKKCNHQPILEPKNTKVKKICFLCGEDLGYAPKYVEKAFNRQVKMKQHISTLRSMIKMLSSNIFLGTGDLVVLYTSQLVRAKNELKKEVTIIEKYLNKEFSKWH